MNAKEAHAVYGWGNVTSKIHLLLVWKFILLKPNSSESLLNSIVLI